MKKYLTVQAGNEEDAKELKNYRLTCHEEQRPCIIITKNNTHADISCDNWLGTDGGLIRVEARMKLEDRFKQLQKNHPASEIAFSTSEVRASEISNPLPLWYNFTNVPLTEAENFAEKVYDIYLAALPHGS